MTHRVHPTMKEVEAASAETTLDRVFAQAEPDELSPGDDAVLSPCERRDLPVRVR